MTTMMMMVMEGVLGLKQQVEAVAFGCCGANLTGQLSVVACCQACCQWPPQVVLTALHGHPPLVAVASLVRSTTHQPCSEKLVHIIPPMRCLHASDLMCVVCCYPSPYPFAIAASNTKVCAVVLLR